MFEAVIVNGSEKRGFGKVAILEMDSEGEVDVESLWFRKLDWVRGVKVDSG